MSRPDAATTHRRGFLGSLAATVAVVTGGALAERAHAASRVVPPAWSGAPDVESWPPVKGKHHQVYDAVSWNHGLSLVWAKIFLDTNNQASKAPDSDLTAVVVLRHEAIPLAFTDSIWARYKLGEAFSIDDPGTKAPAVRNPFYHAHPGELTFDDMAIDRLQQRGVQFGVCLMALGLYSGLRAKAVGVDPDVAHKEWLAGVIPGIAPLPSGVWGVNRAQERGCSYCYAS